MWKCQHGNFRAGRLEIARPLVHFEAAEFCVAEHQSPAIRMSTERDKRHKISAKKHVFPLPAAVLYRDLGLSKKQILGLRLGELD